uniref:Uncharacterized protein n=1 Tax=Anguilla anguilla TaxID=7936 RepID=A0A0E9X388_ANGAN
MLEGERLISPKRLHRCDCISVAAVRQTSSKVKYVQWLKWAASKCKHAQSEDCGFSVKPPL